MLEAGYVVTCYTSIEVDEVSCTKARRTLSDLREEFPRQL